MRAVSCRRGTSTVSHSSGSRAVHLSAAVLLGSLLGVPGAGLGAPVVSSHLKVLVPSGGGPVDLFTFPMPDPCPVLPCPDQRVMMAKFIVDATVADLSF